MDHPALLPAHPTFSPFSLAPDGVAHGRPLAWRIREILLFLKFFETRLPPSTGRVPNSSLRRSLRVGRAGHGARLRTGLACPRGLPIPRSGNQGPNQSHAQTSGKPALKRLPLESDVVLIKPVASRVVVVLFSFFGHWPKTFSRVARTENPRESTSDSPRPRR